MPDNDESDVKIYIPRGSADDDTSRSSQSSSERSEQSEQRP